MFVSSIFQFHKGTIRTLRKVGAILANTRFQFHKGTIRTVLKGEQEMDAFNFNSIKVRLEPFSFCFSSSSLLFQFHKGTIRTQQQSECAADRPEISIP